MVGSEAIPTFALPSVHARVHNVGFTCLRLLVTTSGKYHTSSKAGAQTWSSSHESETLTRDFINDLARTVTLVNEHGDEEVAQVLCLSCDLAFPRTSHCCLNMVQVLEKANHFHGLFSEVCKSARRASLVQHAHWWT